MNKEMQGSSKLITIGLPFFNNEKTLHYTLKSILKQSFSAWKLILINDGSTDNSQQHISDDILNDPRVIYINDKINRGLVYRLNQIADLCDTPFLARMDADDLISPDRIEIQLKYLLDNPDVDLVDSALCSIDENNQVVGVRGMEPIRYTPVEVVRSSMLNHATIVGKTSWFKENKYNAEFLRAEDYELWCRTFSFSNFKRIESPLYIVREGKVNVRNYLNTMHTCRKILRLYGPEYLSGGQVKKEILKTHIKAFLYKITGIFRMQDILSKNRNRSFSEKDRKQMQIIISGIIEDNKD